MSMNQSHVIFSDFKPQHDFLVFVDSDGCVFDNMELKHKECFIPNIIKFWNLQPVSKYARETAEFVNLYSRWRGINRFPALIKMFDFLKDRPEVQRMNVEMPDIHPLRKWIENSTTISNTALREEVDRTGDPVLQQTLKWSEAVNEAVADMVHGVPPFPGVAKSLSTLNSRADIIVCSVTHTRELQREWQEHDLAQYTSIIAGQEFGTKETQIGKASVHYPENHVLMIGDAPGDLNAAHANNVAFYPIIPGEEIGSWNRFNDEIIDLFLAEKYTSEQEARFVSEFLNNLPEIPPWK